MSDLKFADTHNLVAFLEKPTESKGFEEIVDFLNANHIKYALTVNPTVYCSCIKQFWDTVKAKTVNREVQLQALVNKKKVIITESTIRRDLQLEDADWYELLPSAIFLSSAQLRGARILHGMNRRNLDSASTCLANQIFNFSCNPDSIVKNVKYVKILDVSKKKQPRRKQRKDTEAPQSSGPTEPIAKEAANEENVLDLETSKTTQALEIESLKRRVKKLEKKKRSRTHGLKRLYKGRTINNIDADEGVTLVDETQGRNDEEMFDISILDGEEVYAGQDVVEKEVSTADPVTTADNELAQRLQQEEQEELTIEEKSKLFQQLLKQRRKFFATKRVEEKRNRPPTKAQQRSIMCTYLKNMEGWKRKDLKTKSFTNIQELFDKAMKRVNTFVDFKTKLVEGTEREESSKRDEQIGQESSSKRAGGELEQEKDKKQKIDDDQEEAEMKKIIEVVSDEEGVAIDAIPLSTKPPSIRYSAIIHMLRDFDREDLETLWKIVKAKHGYTRPEEGYERVLWGDLKTMFEHHVEDLVWKYIQRNKVTVWKLVDSCRVHFVRFSNLHIFMLVEKRYPLTKATITEMLNKKLQADHWNEMCYQLLKLMTKQLKNQ
ncbi:hypothetical protein Tco_0277244 [Tanacetum coccineum]